MNNIILKSSILKKAIFGILMQNSCPNQQWNIGKWGVKLNLYKWPKNQILFLFLKRNMGEKQGKWISKMEKTTCNGNKWSPC